MNAFTKTEKFGHGFVLLPLGWRGGLRIIKIWGGPYDKFPGRDQAFGVCVRAEQTKGREIDLHVPLKDFCVPTQSDSEINQVLLKIIEQALLGKTIYVGCMGGWGRTGLFLSLLAKAAGISDPIEFVRIHYTPHAVETEEQQDYVNNYDVTYVQNSLPWLTAKVFWSDPLGWWGRY